MFFDPLKIQEAQDTQEQSFSMKEKDETKKIKSEMEQLKEQLKAKESALLRLEMEKLTLSERLQESHEEINSVTKERNDLCRLQEVLQDKNDQLKENVREITAKVSCIRFSMYVWVCLGFLFFFLVFYKHIFL